MPHEQPKNNLLVNNPVIIILSIGIFKIMLRKPEQPMVTHIVKRGLSETFSTFRGGNIADILIEVKWTNAVHQV